MRAFRMRSHWAMAVVFLGCVVGCSSGGGNTPAGSGGTVGNGGAKGGTTTGGSTGGVAQTGGQTSPGTGGNPVTSTGGRTMGTGGLVVQTTGGVASGGAVASGGSSTPVDAATGGTGARTGGQSAGGSQGSGDASTMATGGVTGGDASVGTGGGRVPDAGTETGRPATDASTLGSPKRMVLVDEGNKRVLLLDMEKPGTPVWSKDFPTQSPRDLQLVGGNRVAVSSLQGYLELDLDTGTVAKEVKGFTGVESIRRLPGGTTLLAGNSDGGVTLQELDAQDKPVTGRKVTFTNLTNLRIVRRTPQGTFLVGVGDKLAEVNWQKQIVWEMPIPGGNYVYQGVRLSDGRIAVTSGYGATVVILDPEAKKVLTTLGGKSQADAATIVPNFYAGFQVLANGHILVTNWQGHGAGNGTKGIQLLQYDPSGKVVWKWNQDSKVVSSLHHVIVLDGLDTKLSHDDVTGTLTPVAP